TSQMETFSSAKSMYHPHLLACSFMLSAFVLYPLYGRTSAVLAALISLVTFTSQILELSLHDNLLRRIVPKGDSQNVYAVLPPREEHKQDLVLIGHVDSHRTPLIFQSQAWVKAFTVLSVIVIVLGLAQVVLYIIGSFTSWSWIWPVTISTAIGAVIMVAIFIQADRTPFSHGANDNATGAGLILTLAQHFQNEPLQNTRVWLVCTGCEEVLLYGAIDFFRRHTSELKNPVAVVFEMLGCAGPAWLTSEGIIIPFKSDRTLVQLAEQIAQANPHLGVYPSSIYGGVTEMAAAVRAGVPAITLDGMSPEGFAPYWHQVEDTYDKMDPEVMTRVYEYTWEYIKAIDSMTM
ncbi:MAG: M28 family peptidase, partial [Anaerolineaceae bacterium]